MPMKKPNPTPKVTLGSQTEESPDQSTTQHRSIREATEKELNPPTPTSNTCLRRLDATTAIMSDDESLPEFHTPATKVAKGFLRLDKSTLIPEPKKAK